MPFLKSKTKQRNKQPKPTLWIQKDSVTILNHSLLSVISPWVVSFLDYFFPLIHFMVLNFPVSLFWEIALGGVPFLGTYLFLSIVAMPVHLRRGDDGWTKVVSSKIRSFILCMFALELTWKCRTSNRDSWSRMVRSRVGHVEVVGFASSWTLCSIPHSPPQSHLPYFLATLDGTLQSLQPLGPLAGWERSGGGIWVFEQSCT